MNQNTTTTQHRSIPSLSSSISSVNSSTQPTINSSSPRNSSTYQHAYSLSMPPSPTMPQEKRDSVKRWDDSQLEMELAEDDLMKVRRNSSLRFKRQLSSAESYIIDKFRHHKQQEAALLNHKASNKKMITRSFKKIYDWMF